MSVTDCISLIERHAPLMMRVGVGEIPGEGRIGVEQRRVTPTTIRRMRLMRSRGVTIGEIARRLNLGWRTVWRHSRHREARSG